MIISKKLKECKCRLFHKKIYVNLIDPLPTAHGLYRCKKCDLWREV